jgi:hypothetical protein
LIHLHEGGTSALDAIEETGLGELENKTGSALELEVGRGLGVERHEV